MSKRQRTPEEREHSAKMTSFLQELNVADVQELFKELIGNILENGLEAELDEELGYTKYDYHNKETDNSRNGQA